MDNLIKFVDTFGSFLGSCIICLGAAFWLCKSKFVTRSEFEESLKEHRESLGALKKEILEATADKESLSAVALAQQAQIKEIADLRRIIERQSNKIDNMANCRTEMGEVLREIKRSFQDGIADMRKDIKEEINHLKDKQESLAESNLEIRLQLQENRTKVEDFIEHGLMSNHEK